MLSNDFVSGFTFTLLFRSRKATGTTGWRKVEGKSGNNNNGKGLLHFPAESESNFRSLNLHFEIKFFTLEKLAASNIFILPQTRRNYAPSVGVSGCARTWQPWPTRNRNQATPEPGR